jgi:hypothetical protein
MKRPHGRVGVVKKQCPNFLKEILKPWKSIYDIGICHMAKYVSLK